MATDEHLRQLERIHERLDAIAADVATIKARCPICVDDIGRMKIEFDGTNETKGIKTRVNSLEESLKVLVAAAAGIGAAVGSGLTALLDWVIKK